ncbi:MAG: NADH-quinone oxidoreductase subunit E [Rhizobiales bacterium]|nr:NADH-quinone oxidoreductase subunit E [Hyphomicrobiales bacterium]
MSVRRLAEPAVQPASFAFSKANAAWARQTIKKYPKGREQSAVIPLLMRAQEQEGWVTRAAIEHVADMLEMPYIRVLEVATFYTQYQLKPVGTKAHVQVCGTTPCMLRGAGELMDVCRSKIHPEQFHTNADGTLSWEEVECLGACVNAPMVMIFKDTYEDLTPERLAEIIDAFEAGKGKSVTPGPQVDRCYSAAEGGFTALADEKVILKSTRDREARAAAKAARAATEAVVPPSKAARPKTDAPETSPALKTPSPVKASVNGEKKASAAAPVVNLKAADRTAPQVEADDRPRAHARPKAAAAKPAKPSLESRDRPAAVARPAQPDDLQLISGVGPKIEGTLHSLGIFTYAQVASWKKAERDWVDGYLSFSGRIEREDWVKQAKALAKGGVAEYIRVFGKKPR